MKTIVTHNGNFHADDVFAVATLLLVYSDAQVIRSRDSKVIESADAVVDTGFIYDSEKCRFDHHQEGGAGIRENGIPYASFGLVWKKFGTQLAGDAAAMIERRLILAVDAGDNGVSTYESIIDGITPYTIGDFFKSFITSKEPTEEELYKTFRDNVNVAKGLLSREIKYSQDKVEDMKIVQHIYENSLDKAIVVFDKPMLWEEVLAPIPGVFYVVYPRKEGNWGVKTVPVVPGKFERKKYFPEDWAGRSESELVEITGIPDAIFCHKGKFLAVAKSKAGAIALAEKALNS